MKIPYGKQAITEADIKEVIKTLTSSFITQGPKIEEFESAIANYHNAEHAIVFSNGTTALHAAYHALETKPGDEIIAPAMTFVASSNGGIYCGATPKLVDISLDTYCIDTKKIEQAITNKTKVICAVSIAGYPLDLPKIQKIAKKHNLKIIHDAAHAIGSRRNNTFNIENADFTMFSFHPVKHITTGEGGMLLTNNDELASKVRTFRTHGIAKTKEDITIYDGPWFYEMLGLGHNFRMCDIQCALGISQFNRIEENLKTRNLIAKKYNDAFSSIDELIIPPHFDLTNFNENTDIKTIENLHSYHLYPIRLKDNTKRLALYKFLRKHGIFAQVHYIPVHWHKFYRDEFGYKKEDFPVANEYYEGELSLPMFHSLTQEEQDYVIEKVKEFIQMHRIMKPHIPAELRKIG